MSGIENAPFSNLAISSNTTPHTSLAASNPNRAPSGAVWPSPAPTFPQYQQPVSWPGYGGYSVYQLPTPKFPPLFFQQGYGGYGAHQPPVYHPPMLGYGVYAPPYTPFSGQTIWGQYWNQPMASSYWTAPRSADGFPTTLPPVAHTQPLHISREGAGSNSSFPGSYGQYTGQYGGLQPPPYHQQHGHHSGEHYSGYDRQGYRGRRRSDYGPRRGDNLQTEQYIDQGDRAPMRPPYKSQAQPPSVTVLSSATASRPQGVTKRRKIRERSSRFSRLVKQVRIMEQVVQTLQQQGKEDTKEQDVEGSISEDDGSIKGEDDNSTDEDHDSMERMMTRWGKMTIKMEDDNQGGVALKREM
ncbi:MAG: hypothetical protein Q9218_001324 [Villophora microphyllina]